MSNSALKQFYDTHGRGEMSPLDPRWNNVCDIITSVVEEMVKKKDRRTKLCGSPTETNSREGLVAEVAGATIAKFVTRKFDCAENFGQVVNKSIKNDIMDVFKRARSPHAQNGIDAITYRLGGVSPTTATQGFMEVMERMQPFRFPEAPHIREPFLAYLLTHGRWPSNPNQFMIAMGVPRRLWSAVYTAAVFDINTALFGDGGDDEE